MNTTIRGDELSECICAICLAVALTACGGGGGGSGGGSGTPPTPVTVPNVMGSMQAAASTSITGAGLTLGSVSTQSSTSVAVGIVINESPAAGTSVANGSAVAIVVSSGPAMVNVPNLVNGSQVAAAAALTASGLTVGSVTAQVSSTVPLGDIISQSPAAGASVAAGTTIALVVSAGPNTSTPTLGGAVLGLASGGTVHVLNGTDNLAVSANGAFTLPTALSPGATYNVSIGAPQPAGQTCGVFNGSGSAASTAITSVVVYCTASLTTSSLSGSYAMVNSQINLQKDLFATLSLDGAGNYMGSGTTDTNTSIASVSLSGTYAIAPVNSIPILTTNDPAEGAVESDANAFALLVNYNGGGFLPGITIGVKPIQNATVSTVNGAYTSVSLESTSPPSATLSTVTLNSGTSSTSTGQRNTAGYISQIAAGAANTYTITPAGVFTVANGNGISGAVSADGDLIVGAPITSNGNGNTPGIYVLVKQGTGVTTATINGVYSMIKMSIGASITAIDGKAFFVTMADGVFGGAYDENNAGTGTMATAVNGTYAADASGNLKLILAGGKTLTGAASADGNVFVLTDLTGGERSSLLVGVRQ